MPLTKEFFSLILTYVLTLSAKIIKIGTSEKKSERSKSGEKRDSPVQNGTSGHPNLKSSGTQTLIP